MCIPHCPAQPPTTKCRIPSNYSLAMAALSDAPIKVGSAEQSLQPSAAGDQKAGAGNPGSRAAVSTESQMQDEGSMLMTGCSNYSVDLSVRANETPSSIFLIASTCSFCLSLHGRWVVGLTRVTGRSRL
jgi:hypothetical protein